MTQVRRELMGFRLDWFRFQAYTSVAKASCDLRQQSDFAKQMHIFHFHSSLIDDQSKMLDYTSELSLFCWYQDLFKRLFQESLQNPSTTRHSISFPVICSHFQACRHVLCPEEFSMLKNRALQTAKFFLTKWR